MDMETRVAVIEADIASIKQDMSELKACMESQRKDISTLHEEKIETKMYVKQIHESIADLRDKYQCWQETHFACQAEKIRLLQDSCVKKGNGNGSGNSRTFDDIAKATNLINQGWFKIVMELVKVLLVVAGVKLANGF